MASTSHWSKETDEKINYTKLCRLLVDGGTQAVRTLFDGKHPPSSLKADLYTNRTTLRRLKKPRGKVLNDEQWDKLYPPSGSNPNSKDFDITLLLVLLRSICGLTPPATGWDVLPPVTDTSKEANLARIKYYRNNTIAHKPNTEINDVDFEQHWQDISSALLSLGISQEAIDDLKSAPLGKKDYSQLLKDWYISDQDIKTQLEDVKSKAEDIKSDTSRIPGIQEDLSQLSQKISAMQVKDSPFNQLANSDFSSLIESLCNSFHPNTRQWVLNEVQSFVKEDPSELIEAQDIRNTPGRRSQPRRGMLITAGAGMGKSTIAAKICQTYQDLGCLAGCHFFQFSNSTRNNPRLMLQSIARQMCNTVPGYQKALETKLQSNFGKELLELSCGELFTVLFEELCKKLRMNEAATKTFVIVVDALDECRNDLKSEFLRTLGDLHLLPSWLRFIITTRPIDVQNVCGFGSSSLKNFVIDPENDRNKGDLETFFKDKLGPSCKRDEVSKLVTRLVKTVKGLFLVAFFVVDYLQEEGVSTSDVLGLFPKGISSVYEKYFTRLQEVLLPYISSEKSFFQMLEAIAAAKHPIEKNVFYGILGLKNQRQVRDGPGLSIKACQTAKDLLHSLFPVQNDHVTVFHKSIVDWLIQEDTGHDFSVRADNACETVPRKSLNYGQDCKDDVQIVDTSSGCPGNTREDVVARSCPGVDVQSSSPEPLEKDEFSNVPHEFIVYVEDGNEVLASQCYDVLSDIRNGNKDLNKPLTLTDSEKYALEFGLDYIRNSQTLSSEKKMEVLKNYFVICSAASYMYHKTYKIPLEGDSSHFDVSKEIQAIRGHYWDSYYDHKEQSCPFRGSFHFIHCVGFTLQVVRTLGLNEDELSPKPAELFDKLRFPFLIWNHIAVIPEEEFYPRTSVSGLWPLDLCMTEVMILPCKYGMVLVKYSGRQTLVLKYTENGTCFIEKSFLGLKKLCITPDQRFLVSTEVDKRGDVEILNAASLEPVAKYQSPNVVKSCHVFGQQPWYIVARCFNNKIYIIEGATGVILTTLDVECDENVEGVSVCGHIALSKTWVGMRVDYAHMYDGLFTDDDGNFLQEMRGMWRYKGSSYLCRKLFLLNALEPGERVSFYPRRETVCPCRCGMPESYDFDFYDQAIAFSEDGSLFAYHYKESIFIVKSQDGSLFKRVFVNDEVSRDVVTDIIHLSDSQIILRRNRDICIIDVATNQIKHYVYLPGNLKEVFVFPRKQKEPLTILVKCANDALREERLKEYSIFRCVFHNLDL